MTKADLLAAIAHLPPTAEIRIAAAGGETPAEVIIRAPGPEIWLGDRAALAEELSAYNTSNPEKADSILWHNPDALPAQQADLASIAVATMKTQY
jgi:hypothetical protein